MSLFTTLTTLAASTLIDSYKQTPASTTAPPAVVVEELPESPPPRAPPPRQQQHQSLQLVRHVQPRAIPHAMPPSGLPQNSIWTTMSYPIPRGPCLQKSSLISGCSCQRFMVHPLKATTSFDCDGCGHHASFHRMKSHEEEVEQAAQLRDSATVAASAEDNGAHTNQTRRYITQFDSADIYGPLTDDEDDKTVDDRDEEYLDGRERKRRVVARTGSEASEAGSGRGAAAGRGRGTVAARKGKRKRVADLVTLE